MLYVGGLSPHKNLPRLVEAFARSAGEDVRLVLTGDVHDVFHTCVPAIRAAIERHGLGDRVILTGFVPDEDLVFLYGRAYALVQPSLLEGFGLPAVEAMACGTPVISSRAGSLPEVIGEAGVYFDPTDVGSIAAAIGGLLAEPDHRDHLAAHALGALGAIHLGRRRARPARLLRRAGPRRPRARLAGDDGQQRMSGRSRADRCPGRPRGITSGGNDRSARGLRPSKRSTFRFGVLPP